MLVLVVEVQFRTVTVPQAVTDVYKRQLVNQYRPQNYAVLVSGTYGNSNTLTIEEEAGRYLVALKRSRVPVYTDMQIFEEYNRVSPERGWKPLKSPRSLREWLNSPRIEPL